MGEVKRITIPVDSDFKDRLELIAKAQRRSLSANLEHALEVYASLFDANGKMLVPIDSILMGDLSVVGNIRVAPATPVVQTEDKPTGELESDETKNTAQVEQNEIQALNTTGRKSRRI